jgi:hypothetical protein
MPLCISRFHFQGGIEKGQPQRKRKGAASRVENTFIQKTTFHNRGQRLIDWKFKRQLIYEPFYFLKFLY